MNHRRSHHKTPTCDKGSSRNLTRASLLDLIIPNPTDLSPHRQRRLELTGATPMWPSSQSSSRNSSLSFRLARPLFSYRFHILLDIAETTRGSEQSVKSNKVITGNWNRERGTNLCLLRSKLKESRPAWTEKSSESRPCWPERGPTWGPGVLTSENVPLL